MTSYHGGAGVKIFALDPAHIRLQFEPANGAVMSADLTVAEANWIAHQLLALIITAPEDRDTDG